MLNDVHIFVLLYVGQHVDVGSLQQVTEHGGHGDESGVYDKTVPPSQNPFNRHRQENSSQPHRNLIVAVQSLLGDVVHGNQHPDAEEGKGVLQ